jgi:hypothetical protein
VKELNNHADAYLEYSGPAIEAVKPVEKLKKDVEENKANATLQASMLFVRGE